MPSGYLSTAFAAVRAAGGVCIVDEVQTGFGRVSAPPYMWAFQAYDHDVIPDIVTLGKPMGNGYPVAAVITTPHIAAAFGRGGMEYFSTFGGSNVSCSVALAMIRTLRADNDAMIHDAHRNGVLMMTQLRELQSHTRWGQRYVGDIRGSGLFIGIELVTDRITKQPATLLTRRVINALVQSPYRILLGSDGPHDSVIKIKPPMCMTRDDVTYFIESFTCVMETMLTNDADNMAHCPAQQSVAATSLARALSTAAETRPAPSMLEDPPGPIRSRL